MQDNMSLMDNDNDNTLIVVVFVENWKTIQSIVNYQNFYFVLICVNSTYFITHFKSFKL